MQIKKFQNSLFHKINTDHLLLILKSFLVENYHIILNYQFFYIKLIHYQN